MLGAIFLVSLLFGSYRVHPVLAIVVVYAAALCTVKSWPRPLRVLFVGSTFVAAIIAAAQGVWPLAALLAIFALAVIEGPITYR
jgi:hypothetical protein